MATKEQSGLQREPLVSEPALERAERLANLLASIVENSDDVIVSKNLDGIITSWNRAAERIFGYSAAEAIGQPITLVIPEDRQSEEREILTRIRRGERIDHFETVRRRKDGSSIVVSLTISPVKDAHGNIIGASKIARDITEHKRAQEQISVLAREAEHRSKNILANVQAIINLSQSDTCERLKEVISGRIQAMANVHSLFVEARWTGAEVSAIAKQELAPYLQEGHDKRIVMGGVQTVLEPTAAQAIAVVLHELATNAAKYGALSNAKGRIALTWLRTEDGQVILRWTELGGPKVNAPERKGLAARCSLTGARKGWFAKSPFRRKIQSSLASLPSRHCAAPHSFLIANERRVILHCKKLRDDPSPSTEERRRLMRLVSEAETWLEGLAAQAATQN
ncbi:PAS domain S-box protein [Bradyrhizobium japonicum]|uniref:PAS domain S-box protein n=1 Tax=Bradyrhizobium japonicum TaxID=375 RepID=UPI0020136082|nr:PAS domain S-box protein [Bradyrhizobium japonicum]